MALSVPLRANVSSSSSCLFPRFCFLRFSEKPKRSTLMMADKGKNDSLQAINCLPAINCVLGNGKFADTGVTEPAMILLERLFAQTQKLEEQIGHDSQLKQDAELGLDLNKLESDLHAVLAALKKKEEELQDAERKISLEYVELKQAKEDLGLREKEMSAASSKQERLEEELKQANLKLASQAKEIEELRIQLKDRDIEISAAQSALSLKEDAMNKMKNELKKKSEEVVNMESELGSKNQLLNEANGIVNKQEVDLQELKRAIQEKEVQFEASKVLHKIEEEKFKAAEAKLEKQTMNWLLILEGLNKLAEEMPKQTLEGSESLEDFRRVNDLLADVRSELVSSQKALVSSRQMMEDQEHLLEQQLVELEEQRKCIMSYVENLKDAQKEVESEREKLRVAEARNEELEQVLCMEKKLVEGLQDELNTEIFFLQQAIQEKSSLQEELDRRSTEFEEMQRCLQVKESELVEARQEIRHLKSEQTSLNLVMEEKDLELLNAKKMLQDVTHEINDLKLLTKSRENQLIQATALLKKKDEHVQSVELELSDTKLKCSEAETVVERIAELTTTLVISMKDVGYNSLSLSDHMELGLQQQAQMQTDHFKWQNKQLETELGVMRESLRAKEMEVFATQRALTIKDEELKVILGVLDEKEEELKKMEEEINQDRDELTLLYAKTQERIGESSIGDLVIGKLQLEAAQLEVEAATSALYKLTQMSQDLLNKARLSTGADSDASSFLHTHSVTGLEVFDNGSLGEVETEVARLNALTEQLLKEAGIEGEQ